MFIQLTMLHLFFPGKTAAGNKGIKMKTMNRNMECSLYLQKWEQFSRKRDSEGFSKDNRPVKEMTASPC